MGDELPSEEPEENIGDADDSIPVIEDGMGTLDLADSVEVEVLTRWTKHSYVLKNQKRKLLTKTLKYKMSENV